MGRHYTGAITTGAAMRLEIGYLLRAGYLVKGAETRGYISWTGGAEMAIRTVYTRRERYTELLYRCGGEDHREHIEIDTVPSNLGVGEVPYLVCPVRYTRARILYRAYGSPIFKSRDAYRYRIYYPGQVCSKYSRPNTRYWEIERKLKETDRKRWQTHYNGNATRRQRRREYLQKEQDRADLERFSPENIPQSIRGLL